MLYYLLFHVEFLLFCLALVVADVRSREPFKSITPWELFYCRSCFDFWCFYKLMGADCLYAVNQYGHPSDVRSVYLRYDKIRKSCWICLRLKRGCVSKRQPLAGVPSIHFLRVIVKQNCIWKIVVCSVQDVRCMEWTIPYAEEKGDFVCWWCGCGFSNLILFDYKSIFTVAHHEEKARRSSLCSLCSYVKMDVFMPKREKND